MAIHSFEGWQLTAAGIDRVAADERAAIKQFCGDFQDFGDRAGKRLAELATIREYEGDGISTTENTENTEKKNG